MELFYQLRKYLAQSLAFALALYGILRLGGATSHAYLQQACVIVGGFLAVGIYNTVIYPRFVCPMRVLPIVKLTDIRYVLPVTDVPRGEMSLSWARKYPDADAVRIDSPTQSFLAPFSPRALRDVLSTHQGDFEKPASARTFLSRIIGYGLILSEGPTHTRQRKTLTSSFRIQNIRALHALILAKTNVMIERIQDEVEREGSFEINSWASKVTLDIIGNSLMSQDFDALRVDRQPLNEAFAELTGADPGLTMIFMLGMILPKALVKMIPSKANRMVQRNSQLIRRQCEASLDARVNSTQKATAGSEILSTILSDPQASREEVVDQMLTFLGAGHETTATSIAWALHLLTLPHNLHWQSKLRVEILSNPGCTDSAAQLEALPYLNAVCEETLRLYPAVTATARKAIRNTIIAGIPIRKGTVVTLFPWAVNRHPNYWGPTAEQYDPERWLDMVNHEDPSQGVRLNKNGGAVSNYSTLTFLHGNRGCIGKDFSKAEMRCVLARMLLHWEIRRLDGDDGRVVPAGSITIKPKGGLRLKLHSPIQC